MAPATELGLDLLDTLRTSIGGPPAAVGVLRGFRRWERPSCPKMAEKFPLNRDSGRIGHRSCPKEVQDRWPCSAERKAPPLPQSPRVMGSSSPAPSPSG